MRADRLLAELLIIQAQGQATAKALAEELEVSERTVYRDMEALGHAGIPLVALAGPGGGYSLYREWRSDLTGLSQDELAALLVATAGGPTPDADAARRLRSALRKLAAGLPEDARGELARLNAAIHIDPSPTPTPAHAALVRCAQALRTGARVALTLEGPFGTRVRTGGSPLGLVASAGAWHLVWAPERGDPRPNPLTEILEVTTTPEASKVPAGFHLPTFWQAWRQRSPARSRLVATVRIDPSLVPWLGRQAANLSTDGDAVSIAFESFDEARATLLGCGAAVEVLAPDALRRSVADFAEQVVGLYR
jgi:predicted DNA-binding transcriptional regulator YafY